MNKEINELHEVIEDLRLELVCQQRAIRKLQGEADRLKMKVASKNNVIDDQQEEIDDLKRRLDEACPPHLLREEWYRSLDE